MDNPKTRQTVLAVGAFLVFSLGAAIFMSWRGSNKAEEEKAKANDERIEAEQQEALKKQMNAFAQENLEQEIEARRQKKE